MQLIVVGGVPGAGKSTVLAEYAGRPDVGVLDPDRLRGRLRRRALVHGVHQLLVWGAVLVGPRLLTAVMPSGLGRTVLVHDTATRRRRRESLLRLALWRGWDVSVVLIEVSRLDALAGQHQRGRMVEERAFDRHWRRWRRLRGHPERVAVTPWIVTRPEAAAAVRQLLPAAVAGPGLSVRGVTAGELAD